MQYLKNELIFKLESLYVATHSQNQQILLVILIEFVQARQGMRKVMQNGERASLQELAEI